MKRTLAITFVTLILLLTFVSPVLADLILYEKYQGGDDLGQEIYGDDWASEGFTTVSYNCHNLLEVRLKLLREGSPGYIFLSIREDKDNPAGADLVSTTFNGDDIADYGTGAWYSFSFTPLNLDPSSEYAIVIRAPYGDNTNSIHWRYKSNGVLANSQRAHSHDAGINWTPDNGVFMFEVWGEVATSLNEAAIFTGYLEDDDLLIVGYYTLTEGPYYPDSNPAQYWNLKFWEGDASIIATTPVREWGSRPRGIYVNAAAAQRLTWGDSGAMLGLQAQYWPGNGDNLKPTWHGADLAELDSWCILVAQDMEELYNTEYTTYIGGKGYVLNEAGGVIFDTGIPVLSTVRGNTLFSVVITEPTEDAKTFTDALATSFDFDTQVGPDVSDALDDAGAIVGTDGKYIAMIGIILIYVVIAAILVPKGHTIAGIVLALPMIYVGMYLGIIHVFYVACIASISLLMFVWHIWLRQT